MSKFIIIISSLCLFLNSAAAEDLPTRRPIKSAELIDPDNFAPTEAKLQSPKDSRSLQAGLSGFLNENDFRSEVNYLTLSGRGRYSGVFLRGIGFSLEYGITDDLGISLDSPRVAYRLLHTDDWMLSVTGGLTTWNYQRGVLQGELGVSALAMYWANKSTAFAFGATASTPFWRISETDVGVSAFTSQRFTGLAYMHRHLFNRVTLNIGIGLTLGADIWNDLTVVNQPSAKTLIIGGMTQLGTRNPPLIEFHVGNAFSIGIDAMYLFSDSVYVSDASLVGCRTSWVF